MDDSVIVVIGWVVPMVLSYCSGRRLWFEKRKIEREERFEQIIDYHRAIMFDGDNDRYASFALWFFIRLSSKERVGYLREHEVPETRKFYEWISKKQDVVPLNKMKELL